MTNKHEALMQNEKTITESKVRQKRNEKKNKS